jgi:hypothetical protein
MKRVYRGVFPAAAILSLLLCVGSVSLLIHEYWLQWVAAYPRGFWVDRAETFSTIRLTETQIDQYEFGAINGRFYFQGIHDYFGANARVAVLPHGWRYDTPQYPFPFSWRLWNYESQRNRRYYFWEIGVRLWPLALVAMCLPALWLGLWLRKRRLIKSGHCLHCGYDLRATPGRCPECGTISATNESSVEC